MKNIFKLDRFGKFLAYDLNNTWNQYGLSLLIIGLTPTIFVVINYIMNVVFLGNESSFSYGLGAFLTITAIAIMVAIIAGPQKIYGHVTDKKAGSDYILVPASTFEKFSSMMVNVCVVIPIALFILFGLQYAAFKICIPGFNGGISDIISKIHEVTRGNEDFHISDFSLAMGSWAVWTQNILIFTLGAIFFKKSKAAKTILAIMCVSFVFSMLTAGFFQIVDADSFEELFKRLFDNPRAVQHFVNWFVNLALIVPNAVLMALIYLRLKTIKH